jgi:uncharacterized membrane protein (UPF0127 family)
MSLRARSIIAWCAAGCAAFGLARTASGDDDTPLDLATFAQSTVEIGRAPHAQRFSVWIADTAARQTQGLMFVRDLPADRGMLFIEPAARPMTFWMKNTYIELDMLFIAADHRIVKIAARALPLSLATINSGEAVIAVLEIKGGEAARRGVRVGEQVAWRAGR